MSKKTIIRNKKTKKSCFENIPKDAKGHFLLHFYTAVYYLIYFINSMNHASGGDMEAVFSKYPFLSSYFSEMLPFMPDDISWEQAVLWWKEQIENWETGCTEPLPFIAIKQHTELDFAHRIAVILTGLVEEDSRFGTILENLQSPLPSRRPCLELVGRIIMTVEKMENVDPYAVIKQIIQYGIMDVVDKNIPRAEWILKISLSLWDLIRGTEKSGSYDGARFIPYREFPDVKKLIIPEDFITRIRHIPALLTEKKISAVILRGRQGSNQLSILGTIARQVKQNLLVIEKARDKEHTLNPELAAIMSNSIPVFLFEAGPGETVALPDFRCYKGPVGIIMGYEGGIKSCPVIEKAIILKIPPLEIEQRKCYWEKAIGKIPESLLKMVSEKFHLQPEYITQVGSMSRAIAEVDKRDQVNIKDIREASRSLNRQVLDNLAHQLELDVRWDHLVVDTITENKLRTLIQRCCYREQLFNNLGPTFGTQRNRGVKVLFTGISGTGKTLAARMIAAEIGMDIYRVDLAAVINKYVGETEKNLHRVLSRAEELDVLLLLDEGDALLGRRTEVKTANDRYANIETDFLLQRLETYQGIIIITTNAIENIDTAFKRRMDMIITFVSPQPMERFLIWQQHLPPTHQIKTGDLENLAIKCEFTGAQIRNAVLSAALQALEEGSEEITLKHLNHAVKNEYRKIGGNCPLDTSGIERGQAGDKVKRFFEVL